MTREREDAIYLLNNLIGRYGNPYDEALEMAINTLMKQDVINIGDDLISRKQAIAAINNRLLEPQYQHTGEDWYVGMNCAESELWEVPTVALPNWIPVSERLPEEDGFYLVTVNYGGAAWVHESYFMQCNSRGVHWDYPDVTAWMPIPEHYKGE